MIAVIARMPVKKEKVDEAIEAFKALMVHVAMEEGTLRYALNRDKSNPNILVIVEAYKDAEALKAHSSTPHFREFSAKLPALLSGKPEISVLEEIQSI